MSLNLELLTIYLCNGLTLCGNKTAVFLDYISRIKETPMESPFRKMSVTHDMSKSEREINKQKVLEAKAMNEQDKSGGNQIKSNQKVLFKVGTFYNNTT